MKKSELLLKSFHQGILSVVYVFLVSLLIYGGGTIFGNGDNLWGPFAFLLLFVLSAAIMGVLVLGRPVLLYLEGKKKDAIKILLLTIGWIFLATLIFLIINIF